MLIFASMSDVELGRQCLLQAVQAAVLGSSRLCGLISRVSQFMLIKTMLGGVKDNDY